MKRLLLIASLFATVAVQAQVLPSFGNSRTGTTGMQFLKIAPDARSTGMAGSFISVTSDLSSLYWNPAGLSRIDTADYHVQLGHTLYFGGINMSWGAFGMRTGGQSFFGLNVMSLNVGEMEETTEFQPTGTGRTFSPSNLVIGATYSRILTRNFSFGVTGKYAREGMAGVAVNNVMFDLGLDYLIQDVRNLRFAVTLTNFGINVEPSGKVQVLKINGEEEVTSFQNISVPTTFRLGASIDAVNKGNHVLRTSLQLNHPADNNETMAIGLEYVLKRILFVRTGYEFGQDEKGFPPIGVGYMLPRRFGRFTIDYSLNNKARLGNIHRLTLGLRLK
ncbi:MAG TPA: PorV/PorQ family protein [Bacteroidia bacterium]|nr:PorV/PorQ family protein [Bacteroidia bacterium]